MTKSFIFVLYRPPTRKNKNVTSNNTYLILSYSQPAGIYTSRNKKVCIYMA